MALAYNQFEELIHQLRFLLFEIGIGLPQQAVKAVVNDTHNACLARLQYAAIKEKLIDKTLYSYHISDFTEQLQLRLSISKPASRFYRWELLAKELNESIANEAMAVIYRKRWQAQLIKQMQGERSFWAWLAKQESKDTLPFLEQWGCVGHPYHPNFRAKMGLNRREVLQYSPEFNAKVNVHWCALHQQKVHATSSNKSYLELMASCFPKDYATWQHKLRCQQINPDDFYPIPVHPWQWRNQLQSSLAPLIDKRQLILTPHHQLTQPSMSLRTMIPVSAHANHLKLALGVQTTSAIRTVSPASIENGPLLSNWLTHLLELEQHYENTLFVARDIAGARLNDPNFASIYKQFGFLLRESPLQFIKDNQQVIPLAALFVDSPLSNQPLLLEIIQASNISIENYFSQYCRCVLKGQLHLLMRYGIALEAHQQNTLVVFENHQPQSLIIRDLGGIYIYQNSEFQDVKSPTLHSDSTIITDNLVDTCNKFIHGNLQSNLAYWINHLCRFSHLSETHLWKIVFDTLNREFQQIAAQIKPGILAWHQQRLLKDAWPHKSLLLMRLSPSKKHNQANLTSNPLSQFNV
ncbi:siderophore biosynthetic enzyme FrgA [Legionella busanensis]|uniref:Siderophore biosynthetic enzyme FrgA n=1 Tax=Legionella busanensis TaxID=190655 RepID=A0A378JN36_9GAMM|nr:IucA/IucC family protein [Legionella busanensis]STX52776.1 siderophore biosynthetic enzyme FrgA [Legionella busanensis]